jgi:hypothetical protein
LKSRGLVASEFASSGLLLDIICPITLDLLPQCIWPRGLIPRSIRCLSIGTRETLFSLVLRVTAQSPHPHTGTLLPLHRGAASSRSLTATTIPVMLPTLLTTRDGAQWR